MPDVQEQALIVGAMLLQEIADANGGSLPANIWQCRRVARRFGVRIRFLPRECLDSPMLRQGRRAGRQGVIYVPHTRNMAKLRLWVLHELGEAGLRWDGRAPCVCQCSRHQAACGALARE